MLAAGGVWPAVPVTGYLVFAPAQRGTRTEPLPVVTSLALMTVAGLAVWSVPLLASAVAGVYRPGYLGLLGWGTTLVGVWPVVRAGKVFARARVLARNDSAVHPSAASAPVAPANRARERQSASRRVAGKGRGSQVSRQHARKASARAQAEGQTTAPASRWSTIAAWDWLLAAGLILAAGLYLGFPTESIYGGRDEGVYASHAIYLAHHGRLDVPYPWPEDLRATFSDAWDGFPGFYETQPTMTVQFGHLFPVWMAQAFASLGPHGLFRLNAVFALLSLAVFYGLCRTVVAKPYAVVATLFLALNPSQLWMARITLAEIFTQLWIWSGLLLLLQARREDRRSLARWAGVFLGLSALVRFDGLLLIPLLLLSHLTTRIVEEPPGTSASVWRALYQTVLPVYAVAFSYYVLVSTPYFHDLSKFYVRQLAVGSAIALLLLLASTAGVVKFVRRWLTGRTALGILGLGTFALAAYAYWVRPSPSPAPKLVFPRPGFSMDASRDYSRDSLVNLARYLSFPVVWTGIAGWFLGVRALARWGRDPHLVPALVVITGCSLLYLWDPVVYPDHFWAIRRFVPVVIPGFILSAGLGASAMLDRIPKPWSIAAAALALLFLLWFTIGANALILTFAEDKGYFAQLEQLADKLPRDELIVAHGDRAWTGPLYIAFDRKVVPLNLNHSKGAQAWKTWVAAQASQHRPVYLLIEADVSGSQADKVDEVVLSRSFSEPTVNPLPRRILTQQTRIELYKITQQSQIYLHETRG
ncbi:MAG: ArnT family glycosyltransferase [Candidatus Binatia bacterium]